MTDTPAPLSPAELHVLCHALGLPDDPVARVGRMSYRNHYYTSVTQEPLWRALEARGLAISRRDGVLFHVTPAGIEAAGLKDHVPPDALLPAPGTAAGKLDQ